MSCGDIKMCTPKSGDEFIGCDGKPHSDDFLKYLISVAVEEEKYETAAHIKKELNRRSYLKGAIL